LTTALDSVEKEIIIVYLINVGVLECWSIGKTKNRVEKIKRNG